MFVVAGATGRTGRVVAETLLAQGEPVRVVVRDPSKGEPWRTRGAEVAVAPLGDATALAKALHGAAGFYVLLPEDPTQPDFHGHRRRLVDAIAAAVRSSGVPHVVLLSATAASLPDGNGPAMDLHHAENALRATGCTLTAIRAVYLQENVLDALPAALQGGIYPTFLPSPDAPLPTVATRDIGRFAARCLVEPPERHEIVDLVGPMYSTRQLAQQLGAALGKDLRVVVVPPEAQVGALVGAGLSPSFAEAVVELCACLASGRLHPRGDRMVAATTPLEDILPALVATRSYSAVES